MDRTAVGGFLLGIDPGKVTGLALYDPACRRMLWCRSSSFWEVSSRIIERTYPSTGKPSSFSSLDYPKYPVSLVVIEDSRRLPIYARNRKQGMTRGARDRLCRNVGRIDRDIELWAEWLNEQGYAVLLVEPMRASKWSAEKLQQVTGWTDRTNEHGRDAARLVWGRTGSVPVELLT